MPSPLQRSNLLIWLASALAFVLVAASFATGKASLLRIMIPASAALVGLALFLRRPVAYVHYTLWIWFLTPLLRRLVDWRFDYADQNLVLLAPVLVTSLSALSLLRLNEARGLRLTPFLLCAAGVLYGFSVGMVLDPSAEVIYSLFDWLAPLLFGVHLYLHWPMYFQYRRAIQKSLLWAVFLLGIYGVVQFVAPPAWDRLWLQNVQLNSLSPSFGSAEPFKVRVYSTLNAPGPFANVMVASLLVLLFGLRSRFKWLASSVGIASFLLSVARSEWLGFLAGAALTSRAIRPGVLIKAAAVLAVAWLSFVLLLHTSAAPPVVQERIASFTQLSRDESFQVRAEMYRVLSTDVLTEPFGHGLSRQETFRGYVLDSGILRLFFYLGWCGALLFGVGVFGAYLRLKKSGSGQDGFVPVCRGILFAYVLQMLSGNVFIGVTGVMLWMCVGMGFAALRAGAPQEVRVPAPERDHEALAAMA